MLETNLLKNYNFISDTSNWTVGVAGRLDFDEIHIGYPTINFNVANKETNDPVGILSDKIQVRQNEIYSSSIFCKTNDYTKLDASGSQVELFIYGYSTLESAPISLGWSSISANGFQSNDWIEIQLENIIIPADIHYISLRAHIRRNGNIWFSLPCLESGSLLSEKDYYQTDIFEYYNKEVYEDIKEIDEIVKTQNISLNELNQQSEKVLRNNYLVTSDEDGIVSYEDELGIIPNPSVESLDFRRDRAFGRISSFLPYSLTFLQNKLDGLFGIGNCKVSVDYANYTVYIEYMAQNNLWNEEITVITRGVIPCNMVFQNRPSLKSNIKLSEQSDLSSLVFNYTLDNNWSLGDKAFVTLEDIGIIKMAEIHSVQALLLANVAEHIAVTDVANVKLNDSYIVDIVSRTHTDNISSVGYIVEPSFGVNPITNIKLLDKDGGVLTNSTVFVNVTTNSFIKHSFTALEG